MSDNDNQETETETEEMDGSEATEPETETVYDDVSQEDPVAIRDAKIAQVETQLAAALADNERLKAQNYDLLMLTTAEPTTDEHADNEPVEENNSGGVDSLFKKKEA